MNDKETKLHKIADIVLDCCSYEKKRLTKEDLLGTSRKQNVIMTRCIFVRLLSFAGYTYESIALIFDKTIPAVRHMLIIAKDFRNHNYSYRIAENEAFKRFTEEVNEES